MSEFNQVMIKLWLVSLCDSFNNVLHLAFFLTC